MVIKTKNKFLLFGGLGLFSAGIYYYSLMTNMFRDEPIPFDGQCPFGFVLYQPKFSCPESEEGSVCIQVMPPKKCADVFSLLFVK